MNNKRDESSTELFICSIIGLFLLTIIVEPIVLYKACKKQDKDAFTVLSMIVASFALGFMIIAFAVLLSSVK